MTEPGSGAAGCGKPQFLRSKHYRTRESTIDKKQNYSNEPASTNKTTKGQPPIGLAPSDQI